jgi:hypothetical protein
MRISATGLSPAQPEHVGDGREQQFWLPERGQLNKDHTITVRRPDTFRDLEGEPGLARPARPGDRHDPGLMLLEHRLDLRDLGIAADERRRLMRQTRQRPLAWREHATQRDFVRELRDVVSHGQAGSVNGGPYAP